MPPPQRDLLTSLRKSVPTCVSLLGRIVAFLLLLFSPPTSSFHSKQIRAPGPNVAATDFPLLRLEAPASTPAQPTIRRLACTILPSSLRMPEDRTPTRRSARIASRQEVQRNMGSDNTANTAEVAQKSLSPVRRAVKALEEFINAGMEKFVLACPRPLMGLIARVLFWPTLWWNQLLKKEGKGKGEQRNWYDRIHPNIILGALPYAKIVPKLKEEGVTDVLNMVAEWEGPVREYREAGMQLRRIPVIDFTPPSLQDIEDGADFIHNVVEGGGTVYVHCKAGRGRSASVCMGYLIKYRGLSPQDAQRALTDARPHVLHMLDQREVIKQLAAKCGTS